MDILGSTQYVDLKEQKEPWYQLSVINQWDWSTKAICFKKLDERTTIKYCLKLNTPKSEKRWKSEVVENITEEMKQVLLDKGMTIYKKI